LQICQIEGVFSDLSNKSRWRTDATGDGSRKRVAKSESPPATRRSPKIQQFQSISNAYTLQQAERIDEYQRDLRDWKLM